MVKQSIAIDLISKMKLFGEAGGVRGRSRAIWNGLALALTVVAFLCGPSAMAQVDQGGIIGVVTDSSGAVIRGAEVSISRDGHRAGAKDEVQLQR